LSLDQQRRLLWDWRTWARDKQLPPAGSWRTWDIRAGRGWGKDWTGSNWVHERAIALPREIALVAATPADARDFMIEGPSGLVRLTPPHTRPVYWPSKRRLTWPNGSYATVFSGAEPDQLRGFSGDTAWVDELPKFQYPRETWMNLQFGMREASIDQPRTLLTHTPKPMTLLREIEASASTVLTTGSSDENRVNLDPGWFDDILDPLRGTALGLQEIDAMLLDEAEGAMWSRGMIDNGRVSSPPVLEGGGLDLMRIVVAIDPAVTSTADSDETGIVAAGLGPGKCVCGEDNTPHAFILADRSGRYTPKGWAEAALGLYDMLGADRLVAETNNGGEMVETTIRTIRPSVSYRALHASRGKQARAEPIVALYEQGRIHHVGPLPDLEDQLVMWEPLSGAASPDRLDALVWAVTELMLEGGSPNVRHFTV